MLPPGGGGVRAPHASGLRFTRIQHFLGPYLSAMRLTIAAAAVLLAAVLPQQGLSAGGAVVHDKQILPSRCSMCRTLVEQLYLQWAVLVAQSIRSVDESGDSSAAEVTWDRGQDKPNIMLEPTVATERFRRTCDRAQWLYMEPPFQQYCVDTVAANIDRLMDLFHGQRLVTHVQPALMRAACVDMLADCKEPELAPPSTGDANCDSCRALVHDFELQLLRTRKRHGKYGLHAATMVDAMCAGLGLRGVPHADAVQGLCEEVQDEHDDALATAVAEGVPLLQYVCHDLTGICPPDAVASGHIVSA